jgi:hypothetical protein
MASCSLPTHQIKRNRVQYIKEIKIHECPYKFDCLDMTDSDIQYSKKKLLSNISQEKRVESQQAESSMSLGTVIEEIKNRTRQMT